jgi:hypothetical protein
MIKYRFKLKGKAMNRDEQMQAWVAAHPRYWDVKAIMFKLIEEKRVEDTGDFTTNLEALFALACLTADAKNVDQFKATIEADQFKANATAYQASVKKTFPIDSVVQHEDQKYLVIGHFSHSWHSPDGYGRTFNDLHVMNSKGERTFIDVDPLMQNIRKSAENEKRSLWFGLVVLAVMVVSPFIFGH